MRFFLILLFVLYSSCFVFADSGSLTSECKKKDSVYIIQIVKTRGSLEIKEAREKLKGLYPDKSTFMDFKTPNQRLFVGYFNTLKEAEKFQQLIKDDFPGSIIVPRVR